MNDSLEDRVRAVEDKLAIFHLIASHPPAADTGTDRYYREAFVADGEMDLGGGKGARGNDTIGALVKTPEHEAAIAGGLCHFAGLPRVEIDGDSAVAILPTDHHARPAGRAARSVRAREHNRLPHPPRRGEPLGAQARQGRLEGRPTYAAPARWHRRCAGLAARGNCAVVSAPT